MCLAYGEQIHPDISIRFQLQHTFADNLFTICSAYIVLASNLWMRNDVCIIGALREQVFLSSVQAGNGG